MTASTADRFPTESKPFFSLYSYKPKVVSEMDYRKEMLHKESRIWELEMKINSLQKENTDLRLSLNYFMQLQFDK